MKRYHNILAIDPSFHSVGIALMCADSDRSAREHQLLRATGGIVRQTEELKAMNWSTKVIRVATEICSQITHWKDGDSYFLDLPMYRIDTVVVEQPSNWFNGKGAAAKDSESIQKLYQFVGALLEALTHQMPQSVQSVYTVTPTEWKGQVDKKVMVARCDEFLGRTGFAAYDYTHDVAEAILLAKWASDRVAESKVPSGPFIGEPLSVLESPCIPVYERWNFLASNSSMNWKVCDGLG